MADRLRDKRPGNWSWFNNEILDRLGATIGAGGIAVYMVLVRYAHNETQTCYPAVPTISAATGVSPRQVSRILAQLARAGLIHIRPRYDASGQQSSNLYTLLEVPVGLGQGATAAPAAMTGWHGEGDRVASTPLTASHREGDRVASTPLTHSQGEGDRVAYKPDVMNQTYRNQREGESAAPSPPAEFFDAETLRPWLAEQCAAAGLPAGAVDFARELAAWHDQIAAGRRPVGPAASAQAADLRLWLRRAVAWAQSHPQEGQHGTPIPPAQRPARPDATALAATRAELAAGIAAIVARQAVARGEGAPDVPPL
ncbi:MAG TPA: helix-turn-helix domain-containing protein [Chloroflexia bacterium]|nr:helix-turn-helix domain-containing protein [Chloroflexia bacterium]